MASDVMRVRLHLRQIRVLAVAVDTPSELVSADRTSASWRSSATTKAAARGGRGQNRAAPKLRRNGAATT